VKTAGNLVSGLVVELTAGMENGINGFDSADTGLFVDVAGNTSAIILDEDTVDRVILGSGRRVTWICLQYPARASSMPLSTASLTR
jgi:hypothetical protein